MARKKVPLLYQLFDDLLASEVDGRRKVNVNDLSSNMAVKFRISRIDVKRILAEMDKDFDHMVKPRGRYSLEMRRKHWFGDSQIGQR